MADQFYCEKWFAAKRQPIKRMDASAAERRHIAGQPYTVLVGSLSSPSHVISLAGPWVSVYHMDSAGRPYLTYDFNRRSGSKLFLTMVVRRVYGESDDPLRVSSVAFKDDGSTVVEDRTAAAGEIQERVGHTDIEANWAEYPAFGDYEALYMTERGQLESQVEY